MILQRILAEGGFTIKLKFNHACYSSLVVMLVY